MKGWGENYIPRGDHHQEGHVFISLHFPIRFARQLDFEMEVIWKQKKKKKELKKKCKQKKGDEQEGEASQESSGLPPGIGR